MSEILVVGAGALGASIAYHLAERGASGVTLVERAGVASGPTGASSAIIRQNYSNEVTARMALESVRFFQHWGDQVGYRKTGCLSLAGEAEQAALATSLAMQRGVGIDVRSVTFDEVREIEPHIDLTGVAAVTYELHAGYADPSSTASTLVDRARERGVDVRLNTPVARVVADRGRVVGVDTRDGRVTAAAVILATGPWTNQLLTPHGVRLPIEVSRHSVLMYERPPSFRGPHPVIGDFPQGIYIRSEGAELTLVGSLDAGSEDTADPDDCARQVTAEESEEHARPLVARMPVMLNATTRGGWASVYDVTPDWHPILDAIEELSGLFVAAGTSGHGFKLSPAIGERVARLVLGDATVKADIAPFRRNRFAEGTSIRGRYAHGIVG
jgi:sarcosine oxidase, subunit beta